GRKYPIGRARGTVGCHPFEQIVALRLSLEVGLDEHPGLLAHDQRAPVEVGAIVPHLFERQRGGGPAWGGGPAKNPARADARIGTEVGEEAALLERGALELLIPPERGIDRMVVGSHGLGPVSVCCRASPGITSASPP